MIRPSDQVLNVFDDDRPHVAAFTEARNQVRIEWIVLPGFDVGLEVVTGGGWERTARIGFEEVAHLQFIDRH